MYIKAKLKNWQEMLLVLERYFAFFKWCSTNMQKKFVLWKDLTVYI